VKITSKIKYLRNDFLRRREKKNLNDGEDMKKEQEVKSLRMRKRI